MFFDHKTRRFSGVLSEISKEKHDGLERLEARGELISTAHPSEEEIRLRNSLCAKRDIEAEIKAAEAAVRRGGQGISEIVVKC